MRHIYELMRPPNHVAQQVKHQSSSTYRHRHNDSIFLQNVSRDLVSPYHECGSIIPEYFSKGRTSILPV